jgi:hypothetical membrane protein
MSAPETTNRLILCGAIAGPLFVISFLIKGATRAGYDPLRHPVSSLALGDSGWVQALTFLATGALIVAFAVGLWRRRRPDGSAWAAIFTGIAGLGLIGAGLFVTDPLSGYPPGTPHALIYTPVGILHDLFSMLFFLGLPLAIIAFAVRFFRSDRTGTAIYSLISLVGFIGFFIAAGMGFQQDPALVQWGGALQRISIIIGMLWLMLLAWGNRTAPPP